VASLSGYNLKKLALLGAIDSKKLKKECYQVPMIKEEELKLKLMTRV
jgi:hypothetical protein